MSLRKKLPAALPWALAIGLPAIALVLFRLFQGDRSVMNWLVRHVSMPWKRAVSFLADPLPFSLGEVLWSAAVLALLFYLGRWVWLLFRRPDRLKRCARRAAGLAAAGLIVFCGYSLFWGVHYYGDSFSDKSGLTPRGATVEELASLTASFAAKASELSDSVARDDSGVFAENTGDILARSRGIYQGVCREFSFLDGPERRPKPMILSRLYSVMSFTGFLFPFTGEANVNVDAPACLLPSTILHEMAHQRGVAPEQEANFVAILAGLRSDDAAFQYSSALLGYIHLSNALYSASPQLWNSTNAYLNDQVRADLAANNAYWAQFTSPVEEAVDKVSSQVYESFLESYDQELGLQSYGACVDLLTAYYFD